MTTTRFIACFPHGVNGIKIGDVVTILVSGDPDLLDSEFRVVATSSSTFSLYRALGCETVE